MTSLLVCSHCDRLYSKHSLSIHQPKCKDNPKASISLPKPKRDNSSSKRNSKKQRPRTKSLSRHESVDFAVCLVCGREMECSVMGEHEKACLAAWESIAAGIAEKFDLRRPRPLSIPSLDGSIDWKRINEHNQEQSRRAQLIRCRRCRVTVALSGAREHRCTRFEPPVEFFF